jgi:glycosyltransferase involved in cell wall biosynthesis
VRDTLAYITRVDRELELTPQTPIASSMASMRLRMLIPGAELARRVNVRLVPLARFLGDPALSPHENVRAVVIGKLSVGEVKALGGAGRDQLFAALARCPHPVYADFSDNYPAFGGPDEAQLLDYQVRMGAAATLTVPCQALAEGIGAQATRGIHVIEDPYESSERPIRFAPPEDELRLCWFGAAYEPRVVEGAFVSIAKAQTARRLRVDFLALAGRAPMASQLRARLREVHPAAEVRFSAWSFAAMARALAECDVVVLPQDAESAWGRGKSHNRMVEAIRAGRLAVASAIPSYLELAACAQVDDDLPAALAAALAAPSAMLDRLRTGQALVRERFAPQRIAARWAEVLGLGSATT